MPLCAAALATALLLGAPPAAAPVAALSESALRPAPDLTLHLVARPPGDAEALPSRVDSRDAPPPTCLGDLCPSAVSVPGFEPRYGRASRTELFIATLQRARIEPVATMAWALVATGIRLDWSPPMFDGNANAHGWGSVMLRLRLRIDAEHHVVFPKRPSAT